MLFVFGTSTQEAVLPEEWVRNPSRPTVDSVWCKLTTATTVFTWLFVQYSENHVRMFLYCQSWSLIISATDARTRRHWNVMQWLYNGREGLKNIRIFFRSTFAEGRTDNNLGADCPSNLVSLTHQESQSRLHGPVKRVPLSCCFVCLLQPVSATHLDHLRGVLSGNWM